MNQGVTGGSENQASSGSGGQVGVKAFTLGPFQTNCYVVVPDESSLGRGTPCWIVDASFEPDEMIECVRSRGLVPEALVLTHAHVDHIAGVADVRRAWPALPVFIHWEETDWLQSPESNLSALSGVPVSAPGPDRELSDGDVLVLGGTRWNVLHTPGHSPGGITLYCARAGIAIVGDALFAGSIGRTDFPGCDHDLLLESIRTRLYTLPDEVKVYPGHGPATTIGREKKTNPFVRG